MDQLFTNHLNKDYPRISPRDGRNTSSHFVKTATLQGGGEDTIGRPALNFYSGLLQYEAVVNAKQGKFASGGVNHEFQGLLQIETRLTAKRGSF